MAAMYCILLLLLCLQYGMSYRIYILPEEGDFCLGEFSGDKCVSWSNYSAQPSFVDHSTTLVFTPGNYSLSYNRYYSGFRVAYIKRLTVIGDEAHLQFPLYFSNIGYVSIHNLTFAGNNLRVDVRYVQSFLMENCTLSQPPSSSSSYYYNSYSLNFYRSPFNRVVESTFVSLPLNAQSSSLIVTGSSFFNYSSVSCINGDSTSSITVYNTTFKNNRITNGYGVVTSRSSLFVYGCIFVGNSATGGGTAGVYSTGDVSVIRSTFTNNEASYLSRVYRYGRYNYTVKYFRGGYAVNGQRNIYVDNCTFSYYTGSRSIIYSSYYSYYWRYNRQSLYQMSITNSNFYHSGRSVYSFTTNVLITNSDFYNISAAIGGAVYSTKSITMSNCILKSLSANSARGQGGTLWSQGSIVVSNSVIDGSQATRDGGAIYTSQEVTLTNTSIVNCVSLSGSGGAVYALEDVSTIDCKIHNTSVSIGNGGAIYSGNGVMIINSTLSHCTVENGTGGAVYSGAKSSNALFNESNIVISESTFSYNSAANGGVLYSNGYYNHFIELNNSTFISNNAVNGGGVAFLRNTSLSISNCEFNSNTAGSDGGVFDVSFSSVSIRQSSLSHNRADNNGGVFFGRNYSTNFTVLHTSIRDNKATNGGVFYVRRFGSNIEIISSTFTQNHATNKGGVMDIGGVTLRMDKETIMINNTADVSGNVISSCLGQVTTYGLEAQPDPVYPAYCTLYNEGNHSNVGSLVTSTENLSATTMQNDNVNIFTQASTTHNQEDTTVSSYAWHEAPTATAIVTDPSAMSTHSTATTTNSDTKGTQASHTSPATTTPISGITTVRLPQWTNGATTNLYRSTSTKSNPVTTSTTLSAISTGFDPGQQSWKEGLTTVQEIETEVSTQESSTDRVPTTLPTSSTAISTSDGEQRLTTEHSQLTFTTLETETKTPHTHESENGIFSTVTTQLLKNPSTESNSNNVMTEVFSVSSESQADKNNKYDEWSSSEHHILEVAIVSLVILCTICIAVCVMTVILFFIACKRRTITLRPRSQYKKLSLTDKQETVESEIQEYSFMEV